MKDPNNTRDIGPRVGTPLWCYFSAVTVFGGVLLGISLFWLGADRLQSLAFQPLIWVVLCMVVVGELRPITTPSMPNDNGAPTSLPFAFALLIFYGLPVVGLVQAVATVVAGGVRGHAPHRTAFNLAQYIVSFGAAEAVLWLLVPETPAASWTPEGAQLLAVALAAAAYFVVNLMLVECAVAMHERSTLSVMLAKDIGQRLFVNGVLLSLAPLVVIAMVHSVWLVPLFAFPLVALYSSATLSVRREYQANHDELTALANRKLLTMCTRQALEDTAHDGKRVGLLLLDLDRFKEVNDTLGHPTGDRLLQVASHRLTHSVRPGDVVARLGGDEFAVLLPQVRDAESAREVAARLRVALAEPIHLDGMEFDLEASVGIALHPDHAPDFELLMRRVDVAMYVAKEQRTGVELYAPHKDRSSTVRMGLFGELRRALADRELEMFYQPVVGLDSRRVRGTEALVRWRHPRFGLLTPEEFVPLVEQSSLMRDFTREVLDLTLSQVNHWRSQEIRTPVAVNLSARELFDPELPEIVESALHRNSVPASALWLEVSEHVLVSDAEVVSPTVHALADLGIGIALDDFGTGYFTLARLGGLPVSEVKLDASFVRRIADDPDGRIIVGSAVGLIQTLGMRAVAEGVEDDQVAEAMRELGCDSAQGRIFVPPMEPADATRWILEHSERVEVSADGSTHPA